jgi:hypothetical protein
MTNYHHTTSSTSSDVGNDNGLSSPPMIGDNHTMSTSLLQAAQMLSRRQHQINSRLCMTTVENISENVTGNNGTKHMACEDEIRISSDSLIFFALRFTWREGSSYCQCAIIKKREYKC